MWPFWSASSRQEHSINMSGRGLCLLSINDWGVRGLSALILLDHLMSAIDKENPPKPCDYFDMIGGTSTSG